MVSEAAGWGMPEELRKAYTVSSVPCILLCVTMSSNRNDNILGWKIHWFDTHFLYPFFCPFDFLLPVDDCWETNS